MATTRFVVLAGGAIAQVDQGRATVLRCTWLCQVAFHNPEPDCEGDRWSFVDCGGKVRVHPQYPDDPLGDATICDAGHDRLPCSVDLAPYGPAWQRDQETALNTPARRCSEHGVTAHPDRRGSASAGPFGAPGARQPPALVRQRGLTPR